MFPYPHATPENFFITKTYVGDRQKKVLYTELNSIGTFVARILADPRTLNQTVITYDGEASLNDVSPVVNRISGEDFSDFTRVCGDHLTLHDSVMLIATCRSQMRRFSPE